MKKLLLLPLLLLAIGMLAAVESDPSNVVGYLKYTCAPGLNFVAMPLNADFATTTELGDAYSSITSIQMWSGIQWNVVNYDPDWGWDGEFDLDNKSVVFIMVESDTDIYSLGDVPLPADIPQFDFTVGLNTIYIPLNKSSITNTEALGLELPAITSIQKWSGIQWDVVNFDPDWGWDGEFDLSIGMPVFINMDTVTTPWPASNRSIRSKN